MKAILILLIFCFITMFTLAQDTVKSKIFEPDLNGIIKAKFEYNLDSNLCRFAVRNARFGARGKVNETFSYYVQVDLSDEGKIKMLDAYARFIPFHDLVFTLGQMKIPFGTDYIRNPAESFFANRSFVAKYVNSGLRDIGFTVSYKAHYIIPIQIWGGLFNGSGNNNPQWKEKPNYSARLVCGDSDGFSVKGNVYGGDNELDTNLFVYGGEICYAKEKFLIESEIIFREWQSFGKQKESGMYIHGYYRIDVEKKILKYIKPTARYDMMGNNVFNKSKSAVRSTVGINFGFDKRIFKAEIRLNYENYFKSKLPEHTDKFTIEFVASF